TPPPPWPRSGPARHAATTAAPPGWRAHRSERAGPVAAPTAWGPSPGPGWPTVTGRGGRPFRDDRWTVRGPRGPRSWAVRWAGWRAGSGGGRWVGGGVGGVLRTGGGAGGTVGEAGRSGAVCWRGSAMRSAAPQARPAPAAARTSRRRAAARRISSNRPGGGPRWSPDGRRRTARGSSGANSGPSSGCVIKASPQVGAEQFPGGVQIGLDGSLLASGHHGDLTDRQVGVIVQQDRHAQAF